MMTFRPDQNGLWLLCGSLWWAIQFCGGLAWTSAQTLNYTLEFSSAPQHYVGVQVEFDVDADHVEVMMPTWTPGSYLIREYPRFVQELRAVGAADEDSQTQDLAVTKTRKNRWQIATAGVRRVTLRYQVYCHELSVRTNWVDNDLAVLNGAATFLVPLDQRQQPIQVQVQLPPGWARSVCALPNDAERPHTYIAENYDQLVDSPILAGNCQIFPFQVGGINHYLVNLGDDALWDGQKAANDLKKVVAAQHEFWGQIPYPEYYFLNVVLGGGGGLEHDNSTLLMSGRRTMQSPQSYRRWLSLCSHEFFHAWNVRRLRPRSLVQYDYENEVYTRELWVAEGLTSYYQNLLLARAGLMTPNELLQSLSADIRGTENRPGNLVQSLAESSFDSWIDFYRPHENSANTSVSYYGRGSVAGFLLDAEIRRRSNGAASLDDAMVKLYQQCLDGGYTNQDLQEVCQQLTDSDFGPWFQTYIDSATAFDYTPALELWGLRFAGPQGSGNRGEDAGRDATRPGEERPLPVTIGVTLRDSDGQTQVSAIRAGSTGQAAGLNLDDEVLAVNGRRVNAASFAEELKAVPPGEWMTVLVARRGILREIRVEVATNPTESWRLARVPKPTADQEQRWQQWLQGKPVQASETEASETAVEGAENSAETEID